MRTNQVLFHPTTGEVLYSDGSVQAPDEVLYDAAPPPQGLILECRGKFQTQGPDGQCYTGKYEPIAYCLDDKGADRSPQYLPGNHRPKRWFAFNYVLWDLATDFVGANWPGYDDVGSYGTTTGTAIALEGSLSPQDFDRGQTTRYFVIRGDANNTPSITFMMQKHAGACPDYGDCESDLINPLCDCTDCDTCIHGLVRVTVRREDSPDYTGVAPWLPAQMRRLIGYYTTNIDTWTRVYNNVYFTSGPTSPGSFFFSSVRVYLNLKSPT